MESEGKMMEVILSGLERSETLGEIVQGIAERFHSYTKKPGCP